MDAVYSFYTKPYLFNGGRVHGDTSNKSFFLSWALSVNLARRYFDKVNLFTDTEGMKILKGLRLPFDNISLELNSISDAIIPEMWASGKIKTYQLQTEPFIHIDYDVFLFGEISKDILNSGVIAQSPEPFKHYTYYRPLLEHLKNWGFKSEIISDANYAINCGIFGGNDIEFIQKYCNEADKITEFVCNNKNHFMKLGTKNKSLFPIIYEQYALATCGDYYNRKIDCLYNNVIEEKLVPYCHLMAAKNDISIINRIEDRLRIEFPGAYNAWRGFSAYSNPKNRAENPVLARNFY